jgi:predicted RNA-binding protein YlqC (UPF0109 family)
MESPREGRANLSADEGTGALTVGEDDYGKVIGRGGRTANALRTVLKAAAVREERRVLVDIVD